MGYSCLILIKTGKHLHILAELLNIKLHENQFSGSWVVTCRQGDKAKTVSVKTKGTVLQKQQKTHTGDAFIHSFARQNSFLE
jgi:hypothetical protein